MLYYKFSTFIKKIIGRMIDKRTAKLKKKMEKQHIISDWFFCIVCATKYKKVPFLKRIKMYLHGFSSDEYISYELDKNNYNDYLTDKQRWDSRKINGDYSIVLDDKVLFYEAFCRHLNIPKTLFFIKGDKILDYETNTKKNAQDIINCIKEFKGLAFKTNNNGGGHGINIITYTDNKFYINTVESPIEEVESYILSLRDCFVSEYVFQHEYSNKIYSKSINTARVITVQSDENGASIPLAMHRFGTDESAPVDNACSGGIFAPVDVETGTIGKVKSYRNDETLEYHPDTKEQICGVTIPNWEYIKKKLISVANKFPYIKFIAWDVVVTENDFYVLEGNTSTGFQFFQVFEPQKNTKLGEFFKNNNV